MGVTRSSSSNHQKEMRSSIFLPSSLLAMFLLSTLPSPTESTFPLINLIAAKVRSSFSMSDWFKVFFTEPHNACSHPPLCPGDPAGFSEGAGHLCRAPAGWEEAEEGGRHSLPVLP